MNALTRLQEWYLSQCNEDWEHTYGVAIGTLDNPGWSLVIDLMETELADRPFAPVEKSVGAESLAGDHDWISCKVKDNKFIAHGGPQKLEEMVLVFLSWASAWPPNTSCERTRGG